MTLRHSPVAQVERGGSLNGMTDLNSILITNFRESHDF